MVTDNQMGAPNTAGAAQRTSTASLTPADDGADTDDQKGTATAQAAYVTPASPDEATICQNCIHFDGQGSCDHPQVIADPEVNGTVVANGHSKFFYSKSAEGSESEAPQYSPDAAQLAGGARFPSAGRV